jgi:hypothetical protein
MSSTQQPTKSKTLIANIDIESTAATIERNHTFPLVIHLLHYRHNID